MLCALLSGAAAFSSLPHSSAPRLAARRRAPDAVARRRAPDTVALYEDDPWLTSGEGLPNSKTSLDVLFRYGPVVYGSRVLSPGEYNASVRNFMSRYPRCSRLLAEQEINQFLADATGYMARTTAPGYKGPRESDLEPPVGVTERLLVVAWVAILVPAVAFIGDAARNAPPVSRYDFTI